MDAHVLLIEDEKRIADFIVRGLREEGCTVEHAASGDEGWRLLYSRSWDVIVLDWWLPGCEGLELLRQFRDAGHQTPVLFLTARDALSDRVQGLNAGADDYLCKPFEFAELLARVQALSRRHSNLIVPVLKYGDLRLDVVSHRVERAGTRMELTTKEEKLLSFFVRHAGEILTRAQIYEHVWDEPYDGLSNTLEVHVKELRRKLEALGPRIIHTVRGQGYILGEDPSSRSSS